MSTTVVNAYIGPKVGGYVKGLDTSLSGVGFNGNLRSCVPTAAS